MSLENARGVMSAERISKLQAVADAASAYSASARSAVKARVSTGGKLDRRAIDREQHLVHGLAWVARWNGQTAGPLPFTVAQHSVLVERFCGALRPEWPAKWRLAALLHDAPEFVIGDMISPFKAALGEGYRRIEHRLQQAVHLRFGLPAQLPDAIERAIKRADRASAFFEATQIAGFSLEEARELFGAPRDVPATRIAVVSTEEAQAAYLARFRVLLKSHEAARTR